MTTVMDSRIVQIWIARMRPIAKENLRSATTRLMTMVMG